MKLKKGELRRILICALAAVMILSVVLPALMSPASTRVSVKRMEIFQHNILEGISTDFFRERGFASNNDPDTETLSYGDDAEFYIGGSGEQYIMVDLDYIPAELFQVSFGGETWGASAKAIRDAMGKPSEDETVQTLEALMYELGEDWKVICYVDAERGLYSFEAWQDRDTVSSGVTVNDIDVNELVEENLTELGLFSYQDAVMFTYYTNADESCRAEVGYSEGTITHFAVDAASMAILSVKVNGLEVGASHNDIATKAQNPPLADNETSYVYRYNGWKIHVGMSDNKMSYVEVDKQ